MHKHPVSISANIWQFSVGVIGWNTSCNIIHVLIQQNHMETPLKMFFIREFCPNALYFLCRDYDI